MARTAKRPERRKQAPVGTIVHRGVETFAAWVSQNPVLVGGSTAFLVAMSFVSANAIWYQPHAHTAPLFATRSFDTFAVSSTRRRDTETTIRLARPAAPVPAARPATADAATQRVQSILKDLGYYAGNVDGISGPNTAAAISAYQRKMGLNVSGRVDAALLKELGANDITGAIPPKGEKAVAPSETPEAASISRIQQGLRAFGKLEVDVDGKMGRKTRDGIREFESLFGMERTGQPSRELEERMAAEGFLQ